MIRYAVVGAGWISQEAFMPIEAWSSRTETEMSPLSGETPPALRAVLTEWPLVSASMAEVLTGASRAAVQRTLPG